MARGGLAFDQRDASSLSSERDRSSTACHSTTNDENFTMQKIAPNSADVHSICSELHLSSRRRENRSVRHSVQIVILELIERESESFFFDSEFDGLLADDQSRRVVSSCQLR